MERTLRIRNGEKVQGTFSRVEMERRISNLRRHMADNDIDAVVLTSYHNINYFNDFVYCAFGRPYGLIVTQDKHISVTANIDGGQPWRRSFDDNVIYTDWQKDNYFYAIKDELSGQSLGRVGLEFDHINIDNKNKMAAALGSPEFVDIGAPTMRMRMIKSVEEIEIIKHGAATADIGGAACAEAIAVGVPEHEVALHSTQAMIRHIAKTFPNAELMDTWTWFQSGINTDGAHNPVTSRKIESGDILSLNCFPMIAGYYTALERTLFAEYVSDAHMKYWQANIEVHEAGLELIKPGVRCCDIALELNEIFKKHDMLQYRTFGYGHSFGTLSHYYGREAGLELREDVETVLEPGMVVSMEPMIMIEEGNPGAGGYREHDILVVGESGAENITKFPYGPEHNIISH
ncbi:creatininase [Kiloniella litopenaei]|uniref:Creatininase n=1 Tax=Kiloniella litopenaei TaxID=1549748 RepID=A0A0M2R737_9PROT|nr:M24 family metallopeptidase [Kiloniella litopenaei]KKJ75825.1 creatininase [Kiloniella litopenaei]